jgi:hypothetical protein
MRPQPGAGDTQRRSYSEEEAAIKAAYLHQNSAARRQLKTAGDRHANKPEATDCTNTIGQQPSLRKSDWKKRRNQLQRSTERIPVSSADQSFLPASTQCRRSQGQGTKAAQPHKSAAVDASCCPDPRARGRNMFCLNGFAFIYKNNIVEHQTCYHKPDSTASHTHL